MVSGGDSARRGKADMSGSLARAFLWAAPATRGALFPVLRSVGTCVVAHVMSGAVTPG